MRITLTVLTSCLFYTSCRAAGVLASNGTYSAHTVLPIMVSFFHFNCITAVIKPQFVGSICSDPYRSLCMVGSIHCAILFAAFGTFRLGNTGSSAAGVLAFVFTLCADTILPVMPLFCDVHRAAAAREHFLMCGFCLNPHRINRMVIQILVRVFLAAGFTNLTL